MQLPLLLALPPLASLPALSPPAYLAFPPSFRSITHQFHVARHLRLAFTIVHQTGAVVRNASSLALSAVAEARATQVCAVAVYVAGPVGAAAMAGHATPEIHTAVVRTGAPCTRVAGEELVLTRAAQDQ